MQRVTRRRLVEGVVGLALVGACGRLSGPAQPPAGKVPRIGYLASSGTAEDPARMEALLEGLRDLGYHDGRNIVVERRFAESRDPAVYDRIAAELVGLPVDVLLVVATTATLAAKRASHSTPIVFTNVSDPIGSGLVASLGRPGGNVTGLSDFGATLSGKRLELLRDSVAGTGRIGVVWSATNPANVLLWRETQAAAPALGVQVISLEIPTEDAVPAAFETAVREHVDGLIVLGSREIGVRAATLGAEARLPTLTEQGAAVREGALMAYGASAARTWYRAAYYVDKILKGASPADLPVEQPREFDFVINLKTAQALGLTIPEHVLLQATEVIQ